MNKRGFTLVELLVYMAIVGVVVLIAGQAFSDSTKIGMNSKNMIAANQVAEDAGILIRDDIAQMGVKSYRTASGADDYDDKFNVHPDVYMSNTDNSSFEYTRDEGGSNLDKLKLRHIKNDDATGAFVRVEEIEWYVRTQKGVKQLVRSCKTVGDNGTPDADLCPKGAKNEVVVAENVNKFMLMPSKSASNVGESVVFPIAADQGKFKLIPRSDPSKGVLSVAKSSPNAETMITLSGFSTNYKTVDDGSTTKTVYHQVFVAAASVSSSSWINATKFSFLKDVTYELLFKVPYSETASRMFRPSKDHMSVGFKFIEDGDVVNCPVFQEMYVFPPATDDGEATHVIRFTPNANVQNAMLAFTFAFFSPTAGSGSISIADVELRTRADGEYVFDENFIPTTVTQKANVRAFKMELQVVRNGVTGKSEMVIPVPSNGTIEQ